MKPDVERDILTIAIRINFGNDPNPLSRCFGPSLNARDVTETLLRDRMMERDSLVRIAGERQKLDLCERLKRIDWVYRLSPWQMR